MKITEKDRIAHGLAMIEDLTENAIPRSDPATKALDDIFRIAHTLRAPDCRKNHKEWIKPIDAAIRAERRRKPSRLKAGEK